MDEQDEKTDETCSMFVLEDDDEKEDEMTWWWLGRDKAKEDDEHDEDNNDGELDVDTEEEETTELTLVRVANSLDFRDWIRARRIWSCSSVRIQSFLIPTW